MGASPQAKQLADIKETVSQIAAKGEQQARRMEKRGLKTYGKKYENVLEDIAGSLGAKQDPARYYKRITRNFGDMPSMPQQIATYQSQLNEGDYPVLGSPAHQRFEDTLMKSANVYDQYIQRGLNEIQPRFAAIAKDPAFNLQYDDRAMRVAQGNINEDQVRRLTSYNV